MNAKPRYELHVTTWPDRKLPSLAICEVGKNEFQILATFKSKEAADKFKELARFGIVSEKEATNAR
jgi:hypothetical protein